MKPITVGAAAVLLTLAQSVVVYAGEADSRLAWWSLKPIQRPAVPRVDQLGGGATAIDAFILRALQQRQLEPLPRASRRVLIRRATYDLIGMPPTPIEIASFLNDEAPDAYQRVIDRLLASSHYGERWGRHWLDVVRYADTAGETADYPVPEAYRYRNYVIAAFNADKPYDVFVREQIAGDILARKRWQRDEISAAEYQELVTATGFLAVSRRFGFDTERYEHLTIQDTLDTLGQAIQGLTLGCARCHDHKYDPISMEDYYALYGIFASTRYAFAGSERLTSTRAMTPLCPPEQVQENWFTWRREIEALTARIQRVEPKYRVPIRLAGLRPLTDLDGDLELQTPPSGGSLGLPSNPWQFSGDVRIDRAAQSPLNNYYPPGEHGAKIAAGQDQFSFGRGIVPGLTRAGSPRLFFSADLQQHGAADTHPGGYRIYVGDADRRSPAFELFMGRELSLADGGPSVRLPWGKWFQVRVELDFERRALVGQVLTKEKATPFEAKLPPSPSMVNYVLIDHEGIADGVRPGLHIDNIVLDMRPIPAAWQDAPGATSDKRGEGAAGEQVVKEAKSRVGRLLEEGAFPQAYAVWEGTPQDVRLHVRGNPEETGPIIERRFVEALGGDRLSTPRSGSGRRELAHWLTRPSNPLTARVIVNRVWQYHFGHGLVRTENDFGLRGQPPTHPELLDWLASDFVENGWSLKRLHRHIMLSDVYQRVSSTGRDEDPDNRLFAHFTRRRLEAEAIRDALLMVSGSLDTRRGGKHPFPSLPATRYSQHGPFQAEYASVQRSVYLMRQRLRKHRFLALFDAADTNTSTPKRATSTVPTQALYLMNDPFVHEQSKAFAQRILNQDEGARQRIAWAFEVAFGRMPEEDEIEESTAFLREYRRMLQQANSPVEAKDAELAAWAAFARTLFTRNEFVYVD